MSTTSSQNKNKNDRILARRRNELDQYAANKDERSYLTQSDENNDEDSQFGVQHLSASSIILFSMEIFIVNIAFVWLIGQ